MRIIGNDPNVPRQTQEVASGTLPNGKPVVVNADGTVSSVSITSGSFGSEVAYDGSSDYNKVTFIGSNKVVVVYQDNGNSGQGTAIVGTISGTSISFGSATVFNSNSTLYTDVEDVGNNKVLIAYHEASSSDGRARVGTVSGTSISFGTEVAFETSGDTLFTSISKVSDDKAIVGFVSDVGSAKNAKCRIASISGTSVSFGTAATLSTSGENTSVSFIGSDKFLVAFRHPNSSDRGEAIVGTISGTSISFGSIANYTSSGVNGVQSVSVGNSKVVIAYYTTSNSYGTSIVATISGTSVSFGTAVVFESASVATQDPIAIISPASNTVEIAYSDVGDSRKGTVISGTVSDTSISFGSSTVFASASTRFLGNTDLGDYKSVIVFRDGGNSNAGTAIVQQIEATNITSENYIGMSGGPIDVVQTSGTEAVGTEVQFDAGNLSLSGSSSTFDSTNGKIVIVYSDIANSYYGTAIVGTVNGSSITFGTEVVFASVTTLDASVCFDSVNSKVVIAYKNNSDTDKPGTAIVGTVSGNSISFGTAVEFDAARSDTPFALYDSTNSKIIIAYESQNATAKAIVGTVSDTSISFGTASQFNASATTAISGEHDTSSGKTIITYSDSGNSARGTCVVATVSGTGISFGSEVVFETGGVARNTTGTVYDSENNRIVVSYSDQGDSENAKAIVGTVSGTSISFGTAVTWQTGATQHNNAVYHSDAKKVIVFAEDENDSGKIKYAVGTVSDTSINFTTAADFTSSGTTSIAPTYDISNRIAVAAYKKDSNSSGNAATLQVTYTNTSITRGEVADGRHVLVDTQGAISDNQTGLTPAQSYFVQTDGTLGTTAADPSVFAGTAVSATKLIVKG